MCVCSVCAFIILLTRIFMIGRLFHVHLKIFPCYRQCVCIDSFESIDTYRYYTTYTIHVLRYSAYSHVIGFILCFLVCSRRCLRAFFFHTPILVNFRGISCGVCDCLRAARMLPQPFLTSINSSDGRKRTCSNTRTRLKVMERCESCMGRVYEERLKSTE